MVTESDVQYLVSKVVAVEVEPECVDHSVFLGHNDEHCWCRAVSTAFLHGFLDSRSDGSSYEFSGPLVTILIKLIKVVKRPIVLHASDEGVIRIRRNGRTACSRRHIEGYFKADESGLSSGPDCDRGRRLSPAGGFGLSGNTTGLACVLDPAFAHHSLCSGSVLEASVNAGDTAP
ncbi:hypothetical protein KCV03_g320, partial [Aureobasidium melanogenum]